MELYQGRPDDVAGREEREVRVYDALDAMGIEYSRVDHAAAMTMEDCVGIDAALGVAMCKNLFLCNRQKTDFYLLLMPADKPFRTKEVSAQLGVARLSFADEAYMLKFLDIHPGAVSVLGLLNDTEREVQLLIDEDVLAHEFVGAHPCVNTSSLKLRTCDLLDKILPTIQHAPRVLRLTGKE